MNVLAIGAHPDDIEVGCSGTLAKYARDGHDIFLLVMTEGDRGGNAGTRREEQLAAASIIGVREVIWGGYRDTMLTPDINQVIQTTEKVISQVSPDFLFVHYGDDTHQDHRSLTKAVISASRYVRNVLFYEGPTTQNFLPAVFVDIKETFDKKIQTLLAHASQVEKTNIPNASIIDMARSAAVFRGMQGRVQLAEAFVPLRMFVNI